MSPTIRLRSKVAIMKYAVVFLVLLGVASLNATYNQRRPRRPPRWRQPYQMHHSGNRRPPPPPRRPSDNFWRENSDHHRRPPPPPPPHHGDNHHHGQRVPPVNVNTVPLTDCSAQTLTEVNKFFDRVVPPLCPIIAPHCSEIEGYVISAFYCQVQFRATSVWDHCCTQAASATTTTTQTTTAKAMTTTAKAATTTAKITTAQSSDTTEAATTTARATTTAAQPTTTKAQEATTTTQQATTTAAKTCGQSTISPATKNALFERVRLSLRIVGGSSATECEYPFLAQLSIGEYLCGGSIIDETHILTAAHCVAGMSASETTVTVGEYDLNTKSGNEQTIGASQLIMHENYNPETFENDIAVIELQQPIQYTDCVQPICLPDASKTWDTGKNCTVAGWGTTSEGGNIATTEQEVEVPLWNSEACLSNFPNYEGSVFDTTLCAGFPEGGKDACQGDSGGPLMCPSDGSWVVAGVVSSGYGCARADYPGLYTNVAAFNDWINSKI